MGAVNHYKEINAVSLKLKRMQNLLLAFFGMLTFGVCAQSPKSVHVEYDLEVQGAKPIALVATLDVKNGVTIYLPKYMTTRRPLSMPKSEAPKGIYPDWEYMKTDHTAHTLVFIEAYGGNFYLVQDTYGKQPWVITSETKNIKGHTCTKATLSFRGRNWEAWFAQDIPLPYGPWKFYGLPGLIVEVYDTAHDYTWRIDTLEYKESELFAKDFTTVVALKSTKPLPFKKFLEEKTEFYDNASAEMVSQRPGLSVVPARTRTGLELKYEWE